MTYLKRKRLAERDVREANGENFWTNSFAESTRNKILFVTRDSTFRRPEYLLNVRDAIIRSEGLEALWSTRLNEEDDFYNFAKKCPDEEFPVVIEEVYQSLLEPELHQRLGLFTNPREYQKKISEILQEDRINYDFVEGRIIPRQSQALHANVILPVLHLLGGGLKWRNVEENYLKGLKEISSNDPADAITDFGSALEDFLKTIGCVGDTLGKLVNDGVTKAILLSKDKKLFDWVASERNAGEVHGGGGTENLNDAWLVANVVGSLILRWSSDSNEV